MSDRPAETPPAETVSAEEIGQAVLYAGTRLAVPRSPCAPQNGDWLARALLASRKEVERLRGDLQLAKEQARDASHVLVSTRAQLDASRREVEELKASIAAEGPKRELNQFRELIGKLSACRAQLREAERQNGKLRAILGKFVDDEPCRLDHHGYCQAHNLGDPCEVAEARAALADAAPPQEEVTHG